MEKILLVTAGLTLGYFLIKKAVGFARVFVVVLAIVAVVFYLNNVLRLGLF